MLQIYADLSLLDSLLQSGCCRDIRVDTFFGEVRFDNLNQNVGHDPAVPRKGSRCTVASKMCSSQMFKAVFV